jgi:hypothetical protein
MTLSVYFQAAPAHTACRVMAQAIAPRTRAAHIAYRAGMRPL